MTLERDVDSLMRRGFEHIELGEYGKAIRIGRKLRKLRHSSAFEILALAHAEEGNHDKAIRVLEEGTACASEVWRLWQLLGNYRSDGGDFAGARAAYDRALRCPEVDPDSVWLNIGIALGREGRTAEALRVLERLDGAEVIFCARAAAERASLLNDQQGYQEALHIGRSQLEAVERLRDGVPPEVLAMLEVEVARAFWFRSADAEAAMSYAYAAFEHDRGCDAALWLIREVRGDRPPDAKYYQLMIEGAWFERDEGGWPLGYLTSYDVVARSPREALEYVVPFEPEPARPSLRIEECDELEARPGGPTGVYATHGRAFFHLPGED